MPAKPLCSQTRYARVSSQDSNLAQVSQATDTLIRPGKVVVLAGFHVDAQSVALDVDASHDALIVQEARVVMVVKEVTVHIGCVVVGSIEWIVQTKPDKSSVQYRI